MFIKGKSGNPNGRPKTFHCISDAIRKELSKKTDDEKTKYVDAIAKILIKQASKGNLLAIKEVIDRTEGKAKEFISIDNDIQELGIIINLPSKKEELECGEK